MENSTEANRLYIIEAVKKIKLTKGLSKANLEINRESKNNANEFKIKFNFNCLRKDTEEIRNNLNGTGISDL